MRVLLEHFNYKEQATIRRNIVFSIWIVFGALIPFWYLSTIVYRADLPFDKIRQLQNNLVFELKIQTNLTLDLGFNDRLRLKTGDDGDYRLFTTCGTKNSARFVGRDIYIEKSDCSSEFVESGVLTSLFYNEHLELQKIASKQTQNQDRDSMRKLKFDDRYEIAFHLMVGDPQDGFVSWDIQETINTRLTPFLNKLWNVTHFSLRHRQQYYSHLQVQPKQEQDGFILTPKDLSLFINSEEWNLASVVKKDTPIHFLLYVPVQSQSPLLIVDSGGKSTTNAFLVPRWGGIVIQNRQGDLHLDPTALHPIMERFIEQLRLLLGIKPLELRNIHRLMPDLQIDIVQDPVGLSDFELDRLIRSKILSNYEATIQVLVSLANLLQSQTTIEVRDHIQDIVNESLLSLEQCEQAVKQGQWMEASLFCRTAITLAEQAFYDPTMVSMLYFPGT
ncbi:phosphatidylinositol-glycan biosynthesis class S protein-domain-containing protein [Gorgonomyces haynaldii]|nr:phosphatidylinositol-glycan biosynthesis class S protein-domain-containing protein [Gorgonomyces haynaldii]